jgi:hypothetical protein
MVEKALVAVIQEAWINGVSTRKVDELVQAMGMTGISKSSVSKLCKDIDERVNAFLKRPLSGDWPYLWLDATYLKVREGGRIVSVAAIIAVAVNTDGKREIVGLHIGPSEAEPFWTSFLRDLVRRGLTGVKLVISDAHEGLKAAITRILSATWQRCRVMAHFPGLDIFRQFTRDVARAIIRQQPRLVQHRCAVATRGLEREVQRVGDILGSHVGAQLPGDDVAREVVEHGRQIDPAPANDLEWSRKRMSASPPRTVRAPFSAYGSLFNLGPRPWQHHDNGR